MPVTELRLLTVIGVQTSPAEPPVRLPTYHWLPLIASFVPTASVFALRLVVESPGMSDALEYSSLSKLVTPVEIARTLGFAQTPAPPPNGAVVVAVP